MTVADVCEGLPHQLCETAPWDWRTRKVRAPLQRMYQTVAILVLLSLSFIVCHLRCSGHLHRMQPVFVCGGGGGLLDHSFVHLFILSVWGWGHSIVQYLELPRCETTPLFRSHFQNLSLYNYFIIIIEIFILSAEASCSKYIHGAY